MDEITFYKILSIAGAMAWLPAIFSFIKNIFTKPRISIISDKDIEIGYTLNGPIINLGCAFSTAKKDALINKIELKLINENNEEHSFIWQWFEETLMEMVGPKGEILPYRKRQQAIAIKVLENNLVEKKIGFQDDKVKEKSGKLIQSLDELVEYYEKHDKKIEDLKPTKEYNELIDYSKNAFLWKIGKYKVKMKLFTLENKEAFQHSLEFRLTNLDIRRLETNIAVINTHIENYYIVHDLNYKSEWTWVYPRKLED